ncbi:MAG TPA: thioredoxin domain-containing protein [Gemmatimonadaceae bacterium]|nr:thioredoxin domain-containing protein [Gemmatimonadaceae bacterium]
MAKNPPPRKGNRRFATVIVIVAVVGVAALGYAVSQPREQARVIDPNTPLPKPLGHVMGSDSAPVEITMFGDFECPTCGQFTAVTEPDVRSRIVGPGLARFRYLDFVIPGHKNSPIAHNAAWCAGAQGKFWEMHDQIYEHQTDWSDLVQGKDAGHPERTMQDYAKAVGVDMDKYNACMQNRDFELQIRANAQEGERLGINGTPTIIVGKHVLPAGSAPYDMIKAYVDTATAEAKAAATKKP